MTAEYYPNDCLKYLCIAKLCKLEVSKLWYPYLVRILIDVSHVFAINLWDIIPSPSFSPMFTYLVLLIPPTSQSLESSLQVKHHPQSWITFSHTDVVQTSSLISSHVPLIPSDCSSYESPIGELLLKLVHCLDRYWWLCSSS